MASLTDDPNEASEQDGVSVAVLTPWRLLRSKREITIHEGTLTMGRGFDCHVVIDSPGASRLHARLIASYDNLIVEDAGSTNGVYVNGERIKFSRELQDGDRILIGTVEYVVAGTAPVEPELVPGSDPSGRQTPPAKAAVPTWAPEDGVERDSDGESSTARCDAIVTLGRLADRMLTMGRPDAAIRILGNHLRVVLDGAAKGERLSQDTFRVAVQYALKLAAASRDGRWLDYVIELHTVMARLPEPEIARQLQARAAQGIVIDLDGLRRYKTVVQRLMDEGDEFDRLVGEMVLSIPS